MRTCDCEKGGGMRKVLCGGMHLVWVLISVVVTPVYSWDKITLKRTHKEEMNTVKKIGKNRIIVDSIIPRSVSF